MCFSYIHFIPVFTALPSQWGCSYLFSDSNTALKEHPDLSVPFLAFLSCQQRGAPALWGYRTTAVQELCCQSSSAWTDTLQLFLMFPGGFLMLMQMLMYLPRTLTLTERLVYIHAYYKIIWNSASQFCNENLRSSIPVALQSTGFKMWPP